MRTRSWCSTKGRWCSEEVTRNCFGPVDYIGDCTISSSGMRSLSLVHLCDCLCRHPPLGKVSARQIVPVHPHVLLGHAGMAEPALCSGTAYPRIAPLDRRAQRNQLIERVPQRTHIV